MDCHVALLVDWRPIAGVLDVQWLEVVHGPRHQITWWRFCDVSDMYTYLGGQRVHVGDIKTTPAA